MDSKIRSPNDKALAELCDALRAKAGEVDSSGRWPAESLRLCARAGVFEWFLPPVYGGQNWSDLDITRGYLQLSAACLTTTFIITQRTAACRRIVDADREDQRRLWLPGLASGEFFATVGISHLTTSRRHLANPAMQAEPARDGYILNGFSPWVTGADHADVMVLGATLADGRQILVAVPKDAPGVIVEEPVQLVGLSSSHTGEVRCKHVHAQNAWLLAGPRENVMAHGSGAGTGGLQTSTLAIGLATSCIDYLAEQAERRADLKEIAAGFERDRATLEQHLLAAASGAPACSTEQLRGRANSLALRASQAALTAAKGTGYAAGHPTGRWCREALFFLVWSCPQPVAAAALCEFAGLGN